MKERFLMYFYVMIDGRIIDELFVNHLEKEEIDLQIEELQLKHGERAMVQVSKNRIVEPSLVD